MGGIQKTKFNASDYPAVFKSIAFGHPWNFRKLFFTPGATSFTIPDNIFKMRALVFGAGGSGAMGVSVGGGGGGGYTEHYWDCVPGTVLSLVIGAGGAPVLTHNVAGNNGGTSSLTDAVSSVSLSSTGGTGGPRNTTPLAAPGGVGTGGILTANGGAGGAYYSTAGYPGGGAAGSWLGVGGAGGMMVPTTSLNGACGGGAIGGHRGGSYKSPAVEDCMHSGAGVFGPGCDSTAKDIGVSGGPGVYPGGRGALQTTTTSQDASSGIGPDWWDAWDILGSGGGSGSFSLQIAGHGGPGAGGGGGGVGGNGGILGGGGGAYNGSAGSGGLGGGGGAALSGVSTILGTSGAGGNGLIILYW